MFGDRQFHVDLVKKPKNENPAPNEMSIDLEGKTAIISHAVERSIRKIGIAVCAYVVFDTFRKVMVEIAKSE